MASSWVAASRVLCLVLPGRTAWEKSLHFWWGIPISSKTWLSTWQEMLAPMRHSQTMAKWSGSFVRLRT